MIDVDRVLSHGAAVGPSGKLGLRLDLAWGVDVEEGLLRPLADVDASVGRVVSVVEECLEDADLTVVAEVVVGPVGRGLVAGVDAALELGYGGEGVDDTASLVGGESELVDS